MEGALAVYLLRRAVRPVQEAVGRHLRGRARPAPGRGRRGSLPAQKHARSRSGGEASRTREGVGPRTSWSAWAAPAGGRLFASCAPGRGLKGALLLQPRLHLGDLALLLAN